MKSNPPFMLSEEDYIAMQLDRQGGSQFMPTAVVERIKQNAKTEYARLRIQHEEWLEVRQHYELWANNSLKVIKKTPAPRGVLTVTVPQRMIDRLNGLPRGNKSAYVTRLLARGWLSQMGDSE